jgi:hypothetical protein
MIVRVALSRSVRLSGMVALAALMTGALAGCKTTGSSDTTGSISSPAAPRGDADWRRDIEALSTRFRANPRDADNAIR